MKKIYLTKYGQSRFANLGDYPIEAMIRDAGATNLDDVDRGLIEHVAIAGLLTPTLNRQLLIAGLVAMDPAYTNKSIKAVANACDSGGLIAKGHPISATGVAMIGWVHEQLLRKVPEALQIPGAKTGATLNIGGPICSTVATVQRPA